MPLRTLALGGDTPAVDIIAVHGLNPRGKKIEDHAWDTWRTPPGPNGHLWLRDYLPNDVPTARIFLYEYDSTVLGSNKETFVDAGNALLQWLHVAREQCPQRPLLFICHSLGGLLVKQALVNAKANEFYSMIKDSVFALVFFGTPHEGGNTSLVRVGTTATHIAKFLGFGTNESIVMALKSGSIFADCLQESFRHQLENYLFINFWEGRGNIVSKKSATFGLAGSRENIVRLEADHRSMCKFNLACAEDKDNYTLVMGNLSPIIAKAAVSRPIAQELSPQALVITLLDAYYTIVKDTNNKHDTIMSDDIEDDISWVTITSQYESWISKRKSHLLGPTRILWCLSGNTMYTTNHFSSAFQQKNMSVLCVDCHRMLTPPADSVPAILETKLPTVLVHDTKATELLFRNTLLTLGLEEQVTQTHKVWKLIWELLVQTFTIALPELSSQSFGHYIINNMPRGEKTAGDSLSTLVAVLGKLLNEWIESPVVILDNLDILNKRELRLLDNAVTSLLQNSQQLKLMFISKSRKNIELQEKALLIDKDTAYHECSDSFYFPNMTLGRDYIATASVNTNNWIWSNSSYLSWINEPSVSALWISGKPGSGKSVLARTLEANLPLKEDFRDAIISTWFYSKRGELISHRQMLSALMYQLLRADKNIFKWISRDYQMKRVIQANNIQWSFDEMKGLFQRVAHNQNLNKPFVFVVDGIDESCPQGIKEEGSRATFLQYLLDVIVSSPTRRIKIIFLSRLEHDIRSTLQELPSIVMHRVNSKDIAKVTAIGIKGIIEELRNFQDLEEEEVLDSEEDEALDPEEDEVLDVEDDEVLDSEEDEVPDSEEDEVPDPDDDTVPDSEEDEVPDSEEDEVPDPDDDKVPESEEDKVSDSEEDEVPDPDEDRLTVISGASLGSVPSGIFKEAFKKARGAQSASLQHLREYLINNADGVVLWVSSILSHIQMSIRTTSCTLPQLVGEVPKLPTELYDVYITILRNMTHIFTNSSNIASAQRALLWVRCNPTAGKFYAQDLLEVLKLQGDDPWASITGWSLFSTQLSRCVPFLEIVSPETGWKGGSYDHIQLLHHTVKIFLNDPVASEPLYLSEDESKKQFDSDCKIYIRKVFSQVQSKRDSLAAGLISTNESLDKLIKNILAHLEKTSLISFILISNPAMAPFIPTQYKEILKVLLVTHPDASDFGLGAICKLSYQACINGQANALCAVFALSSTWLHPWEWYLLEPEFLKGAIQAAQKLSMNYALSKLYCYASKRGILNDMLPKEDPISDVPGYIWTPTQRRGAQQTRIGEGPSSRVIEEDIDIEKTHLHKAASAEVDQSPRFNTLLGLSRRYKTEVDPQGTSKSGKAIDELLAFWVKLAKTRELHSIDAFKGEAHLVECQGIAWRMAIIHSTIRKDAGPWGCNASFGSHHDDFRWNYVRFSDGIRNTVSPIQKKNGKLDYGLELGCLAKALRRLEEAPTGVGSPTLADLVWRDKIKHYQGQGGTHEYKYLPIISTSLDLGDSSRCTVI